MIVGAVEDVEDQEGVAAAGCPGLGEGGAPSVPVEFSSTSQFLTQKFKAPLSSSLS